MFKIIKRDLTVILSNKRERLFLLFYIPFLILIIESYEPKWLYLSILVAYTYMFSIMGMAYDMKGKGKYIMNSLPITRKEFVLYKYLSIFVYFFLTIVYSGVYLWIINKIGLKSVEYFNLKMIMEALPIVMISIAIVFPAYFRFEPRIAQIVHMIVFLTFFIGLVNLNIVGMNSIVKRIGFFEGQKKLLVATVIYILSLILSLRLYENRDL